MLTRDNRDPAAGPRLLLSLLAIALLWPGIRLSELDLRSEEHTSELQSQP
mgnify:CR=1 FL=1